MALADDIQKKLLRLDSIPETLITRTERAQREIFNEALRLIAELELQAGKVVLNQANVVKVNEIINQLGTVIFEGEYRAAVVEFGKEFAIQKGLNDDIFREIFDNFLLKEEYGANFIISRRNAIRLLSQDQVGVQLLDPVRNSLNSALSVEQDFADVVTELRRIIEGDDELDGDLLRHVKRVARDSFNQADRGYTEIISDDLGFEWFRYQGNLVRDSRQFCIDRVQKIFHISEIMAWGSIPQWQGRNKDTNESNIRQLLGGYNCTHSLIPVGVSAVPPDVRARVEAQTT